MDVDGLQRRLDADLARLAATHDVPGVSVAVWAGGQQVESTAGVINLRTQVPVTPDTLFMIQSVTKVWTATAVLQLVDEGRVELDDPVRRHLPEFRTADEQASGQITVRHLLTHTGGFEGDLWAPTTTDDEALRHFVDDLVPGAAQHSEPGAMYSYSNAGCGVLGRLVEIVRGCSYPRALRQWLFEPLGIEEVGFDADEALALRTAIGHAAPSAGLALRPLPVWAVMPASNPAAGNQLAMSARSLLALGRLHLDDGLGQDGTQVLSAGAVRAMRTAQVVHPPIWGPGSAHGFGWFVSGRDGLIEHGGDTIGVASALQVVPERGVALAVLTNADSGHALIRELLDPLLLDLAGVEPAPATAVPPVGGRAGDLRRYVGRYETRVSRQDVTCDADGRLWLEQRWLREGLDLAERAGVESPTTRAELRPVDPGSAGDDVFVQVVPDESGGDEKAAGTMAFLGRDTDGRARFLHTGRAAPRVL